MRVTVQAHSLHVWVTSVKFGSIVLGSTAVTIICPPQFGHGMMKRGNDLMGEETTRRSIEGPPLVAPFPEFRRRFFFLVVACVRSRTFEPVQSRRNYRQREHDTELEYLGAALLQNGAFLIAAHARGRLKVERRCFV
jgi:hypothetical protein